MGRRLSDSERQARQDAKRVAWRLRNKKRWSPADMKITKSQARLMAAIVEAGPSQMRAAQFSQAYIDENMPYRTASRWLKDAGYSSDGLPNQMRWQDALKLNDQQLLQLTRRKNKP